MSESRYRIVFDGKLLSGFDITTAKLNLAALFKCDVSTIERLFSGKAVSLKRNLPPAEARTYLAALAKAGIDARLEPEAVSELNLAKVRVITPPSDDESPYTPPRSAVGEDLPEFGELNVLSVQGRIGRLRFLAWMLVATTVVIGLCTLIFLGMFSGDQFFPGSVLICALILAFLYASITITVQRLHDLDWSGWLWFLYLVPAMGGILLLLLAALPGTVGANRYGPPQPPNSFAVKALCCIWSGLVALGVIGAIASGIEALKDEYAYSSAAEPAAPDDGAQFARPPVDYEKE